MTIGGTFTPSLAYVTGITNAQNAVITFAGPIQFIPGEYISFRVNPDYGMKEINNMRGLVLAVSSNIATVNIDSSNFNAFVYPSPFVQTTPPFAVPVGSGITPGSYPPTVILQDAFDNLPPT